VYVDGEPHIIIVDRLTRSDILGLSRVRFSGSWALRADGGVETHNSFDEWDVWLERSGDDERVEVEIVVEDGMRLYTVPRYIGASSSSCALCGARLVRADMHLNEPVRAKCVNGHRIEDGLASLRSSRGAAK
jgi:hypothetical protein